MNMAERIRPDGEYSVDELIKERSFTMEDGRERGAIKPSEKIEILPVKEGPDDGDMLG